MFMKKVILIGIAILSLVTLFGCENSNTNEIQKNEFIVTILNEARDRDISIEILDSENQLIQKIMLSSKKEFYGLEEGMDISNPSYKDVKILLINKKQEFLIKELNEGISKTFNFDSVKGKNIIISYYPPGRNENNIIQSFGKLIIIQQDGYPELL